MDQNVVFRRSAARQLVEGIAVVIGAVAFLGAAIAFGTGAIQADGTERFIATSLFGFFGIVMAFGAVSAVTRGTDLRVAEIGPTGAWLPEMDFLPWSEIADVRLERISGSGGRYQATRQYRRLGVIPKDLSIRPRRSTAAVWGMRRAFMSVLKMRAPQLGLDATDPAPFGVLEPEIGNDDFDRLVETVRRYAPMRDAVS